MKAMKISGRISSVLAEFQTEHLLNASLEQPVCFNAVTITDEVQITDKTVISHTYFVDHQQLEGGNHSFWPGLKHVTLILDVFKMSFTVYHPQTVTYLTI
jgi:hypothetical protein